jgi:metallo-beta-lactamase class B
MFGRAALALAAAIICASAMSPAASQQQRRDGERLAKACVGRDGWSDPAPPARIYGNTYYVGTCGITVLLLAGRDGHVLIDGATEKAVPSILANIRTLGFNPKDVKLIIGSHEHVDHMGGFAALQAATGAMIKVSQAARAVLETGKVDTKDPQFGIIPDMSPVKIAGLAHDEQHEGFTKGLKAIATPGHTDGGTSWTWRSCEKGKCRQFVYADSMTAVSRDDYRFTDHPERLKPFYATFARVRGLPCEILLTPHPGVSNMFDRLSGKAPLIDVAACAKLADAMEKRLADRLAKERAQ